MYVFIKVDVLAAIEHMFAFFSKFTKCREVEVNVAL